MSAEHKGWIGVDLDGTLAKYEGWQGVAHIGTPVPAMLARVKSWLAAGREVRIFTARVFPHVVPTDEPIDPTSEKAVAILPIIAWSEQHIGRRLFITCSKDFGMTELWDDRCVQVIPNRGVPTDTIAATAMKNMLEAAGIKVEHGMEYIAISRLASEKIRKAMKVEDDVKAHLSSAADFLQYVKCDNSPDVAMAKKALAKALKALE